MHMAVTFSQGSPSASLSARIIVVRLAAIALFALRIGAQAAADEAHRSDGVGDIKDQIEREYAEKVQEYNELLKQCRFDEAIVAAKQAQLLEPDNPESTNLVLRAKSARFAAQARMQQLDARLAHKIASVHRICGLTSEQMEKLKLAGRGDIKRFCDRRVSTLDLDLFEHGSLFVKFLNLMLTNDQMAAYKAAPPTSIDRSVVRWIDPAGKKIWISLGEADGLSPRTVYGIHKKLPRSEPGMPQQKIGDERIKGKIEISRVLEQHLSEARILEEAVDDPIAKGDVIILQRPNAR